MPDANFRDPVGLAWRMLRSGDATARSVLLREGLGMAARPLDALLSGREARRLQAAGATRALRPACSSSAAPVAGPRWFTSCSRSTST